MTELDIQIQVADYLRLRYPNVLFHSDYGSGLRLTPGQAVKQKRLQGGRRAWPDMFIAEAGNDIEKLSESQEIYYCAHSMGLFLELKRPDVKIHKKNGDLVASAHIREQATLLEELRKRGYKAEFACGFDEAKKIIDEYLGGPEIEEVEF